MWGSVTPSKTSRNGAGAPRSDGNDQFVEGYLRQRGGVGQHALGRIRAGVGVEAAPGHPPHHDVMTGGQIEDVVDDRRLLDPIGQPHFPRRSPSGRQQLPNGPPAFHLIAAETELAPGPVLGRGGAGRSAAPRLGRRTVRATALAAPSAGRGHRDSSRATAQQAMPSRRPRAPSPSARLGLTLTGAPTASESPASMAGR